jgi:hypothetical protein
MNRACLTVAAVCVVVGLAAPSIAGQVKLEIRGGLVTLEAKDATIREIFDEWARVGQTRVVNAERVPGGPISIRLDGVPERQALDTLLRSVGGFLAVARTSPQESTSIYDRIMVMPVARPAAVAASAGGRPTSQVQQPSRDRIVIPPPMVVADEDEEAQAVPIQGQGAYGGAQQPGMRTPVQFGGVYTPNPNAPQASPVPMPPPEAQPAPRPGMPTTPAAPPKPIKDLGGEPSRSQTPSLIGTADPRLD